MNASDEDNLNKICIFHKHMLALNNNSRAETVRSWWLKRQTHTQKKYYEQFKAHHWWEPLGWFSGDLNTFCKHQNWCWMTSRFLSVKCWQAHVEYQQTNLIIFVNKYLIVFPTACLPCWKRPELPRVILISLDLLYLMEHKEWKYD